MIISKTNFRVSLFGGSTDYLSYYKSHGALLIYFGLDKYAYAAVRKTPEILDYETKVSYSITETVQDNSQIQNNAVRGVLEFLGIKYGMEISYMCDLPAQTGIGSSSSFTVGLLNAIYTMRGEKKTKKELANEATYIERVLLGEAGGCQDAIAATYGGFNSIHIFKNGDFEVRPLPVSEEFITDMLGRSILIYTGKARKSYEIAQSHDGKEKQIIQSTAKLALQAFCKQDLDLVALLLHDSWRSKKEISPLVTTPEVDKIYDDLRADGMMGGKLLGAGGSGFIFGIMKDGSKDAIREKYKSRFVDVGISRVGTEIL
jgi:D-glycero-alpha-D-manno-heptose-7-phosphate kinase